MRVSTLSFDCCGDMLKTLSLRSRAILRRPGGSADQRDVVQLSGGAGVGAWRVLVRVAAGDPVRLFIRISPPTRIEVSVPGIRNERGKLPPVICTLTGPGRSRRRRTDFPAGAPAQAGLYGAEAAPGWPADLPVRRPGPDVPRAWPARISAAAKAVTMLAFRRFLIIPLPLDACRFGERRRRCAIQPRRWVREKTCSVFARRSLRYRIQLSE